ncbi:imidazoleglycerol-phosphate dehydratase HisB [Victivallaceae bacterium BBE-744-WT-12]|uniref:Imidazoleglycerol-phosphate dehydratase n=1 Tax=Victivallis lenta TaxID=2606640 RepID=A0A844G667_9BACT|nr:imidazoleglycerol-phosphate dehydratase HisB [Victivallales bacterium CCUG 44730]MBS1453696.1 imidazoleglycerol-phosphate dehydratase HisB [Lentisphaeria bacterium]MBS5532446.1 imidazoleglycerol-phosphate dehydratase HisB [bacterium]MST97958.1 imidazoleglycerol-phosphate dehydratase HisB [Victivallis lenta]HBP06601.1 imidazoleglycerol-phosphate dehydratase HisB [Lentisphaeria bacterium]
MMRKSEVARKTRETDIFIALDLDGEGRSSIDTGIPFMNHMLELFAKHGFFDLTVRAKGDIEVDYHHTMEDLGLVLGDVLAQALGDKAGIRRYGSCILPMDETLALVALDLSGRPCLVWNVDFPAPMIRDLDTRLFCEFFQALVNRAGMNLHVRKMAGEEVHHVAEAVFKAFAKALDQAVTHDPRVKGVLSTKGSL